MSLFACKQIDIKNFELKFVKYLIDEENLFKRGIFMKKVILGLLFVGSGFVFADAGITRAEDQHGYCVITGYTKGGRAQTMKGPSVDGGWWKARQAAYRVCRSKGLANCKVDYCRIQ